MSSYQFANVFVSGNIGYGQKEKIYSLKKPTPPFLYRTDYDEYRIESISKHLYY